MNDPAVSEDPAQGTPRRRLFALAGCGVLLLLGLVWFRLLTAPRLEVSLADGRLVKITAITYGTRHRHVHGPPWVKPFAIFLPASWQRRFGVVVLRRETDRPVMMVWGFAQARPFGSSPPELASLCDSHGFEIAPVRPQVIAYPKGFQHVYGWEFGFLPHGEKRLLFRLYERDRGSRLTRVAELPLNNPAPRVAPVTEAAIMAHQVTNQHGQFALLGVTFPSPVAEGDKTNSINFPLPRAAALLQVTVEGQPRTGWSVADILVGNRAGNRVLAQNLVTDAVGDYLVCGFDAVLWPAEPVWLLQFGLVRNTDWPSDALATVGPLVVPTPSTPTHLNTQIVVTAGSTLRVSRADAYHGFSMPHLREPRWNMVVLANLAPDLHLSVARAQDDRGTPLRAQIGQRYPGGEHTVLCEARPESRLVTIQFAVQRPVPVQFVVRKDGGVRTPAPYRP